MIKADSKYLTWIAIIWFAHLYGAALFFLMAIPVGIIWADNNITLETAMKLLGVEFAIANIACLATLICTNIFNKGRRNSFINLIMFEWIKLSHQFSVEALLVIVAWVPFIIYYVALFKLSTIHIWLPLPQPSEVEIYLFAIPVIIAFLINPWLGKYVWPYNCVRMYKVGN